MIFLLQKKKLQVQRCRWVRREEKREFVWLDGWLAGFTGWSRARNATKHAYRVWRVVMGGDDDAVDTGHWTLDCPCEQTRISES
jgi:hypothetical protein